MSWDIQKGYVCMKDGLYAKKEDWLELSFVALDWKRQIPQITKFPLTVYSFALSYMPL
jgi:hypothetical protein